MEKLAEVVVVRQQIFGIWRKLKVPRSLAHVLQRKYINIWINRGRKIKINDFDAWGIQIDPQILPLLERFRSLLISHLSRAENINPRSQDILALNIEPELVETTCWQYPDNTLYFNPFFAVFSYYFGTPFTFGDSKPKAKE